MIIIINLSLHYPQKIKREGSVHQASTWNTCSQVFTTNSNSYVAVGFLPPRMQVKYEISACGASALHVRHRSCMPIDVLSSTSQQIAFVVHNNYRIQRYTIGLPYRQKYRQKCGKTSKIETRKQTSKKSPKYDETIKQSKMKCAKVYVNNKNRRRQKLAKEIAIKLLNMITRSTPIRKR